MICVESHAPSDAGVSGCDDQYFVITEVVISRSDDFFAWLESFEDFVELRVLTADADLALDCLASVRGYNIYPFAAGLLIECAAWDEDGLLRLA